MEAGFSPFALAGFGVGMIIAVILFILVALTIAFLVSALSLWLSTKLLKFKTPSYKTSLKVVLINFAILLPFGIVASLIAGNSESASFAIGMIALVLSVIIYTLFIHRFFLESYLKSFFSTVIGLIFNFILQVVISFVLAFIVSMIFGLSILAMFGASQGTYDFDDFESDAYEYEMDVDMDAFEDFESSFELNLESQGPKVNPANQE